MKTIPNVWYCIFIVFLFFSSCSKDGNRNAVEAGIYDTNFIYHEFLPPLKVALTLNTSTDNYFGQDSIDINLDGVCEIVFSHRIHISPPSGIPSWEQFPYYKIFLKNGLEVVSRGESYPVGMGEYNDTNWLDTLSYRKRIEKTSKWSGTNITRMMWAIPPITQFVSYGPWYKPINQVKYIGIRMKIGSRYHYGWIKVNEISRENIQFESFALAK